MARAFAFRYFVGGPKHGTVESLGLNTRIFLVPKPDQDFGSWESKNGVIGAVDLAKTGQYELARSTEPNGVRHMIWRGWN